jgi:hypothetical protein
MTIHREPLFPALYFGGQLRDGASRLTASDAPPTQVRVPTFEHVDYLHTMDDVVPRPTAEQRASAHELIERLKATARRLNINTRVEITRAPEILMGPITRRAAGDGWMYMGTEWHDGDLFSVPERLPGKTSIALHVAKHREGPATLLVDFRVSLDTLLATAEESSR